MSGVHRLGAGLLTTLPTVKAEFDSERTVNSPRVSHSQATIAVDVVEDVKPDTTLYGNVSTSRSHDAEGPTLSSFAVLPLLQAALFEGAALTIAASASKDNKLLETICKEMETKVQKATTKG